MTKDYRIKMSREDLQSIEPYEDADFFFFNYEETLIHPIFNQINKPKKEEAIFHELTKGQQYFYAIIELFAQTYNGGVGQYFFNGKNKFIQHAIEGLKEINCIELSSDLEEINNVYIDKKRMVAKLADKDEFSEFLSNFRDSKFQKKFFDQNEEMQKKMVEYIIGHRSDFIID